MPARIMRERKRASIRHHERTSHQSWKVRPYFVSAAIAFFTVTRSDIRWR